MLYLKTNIHFWSYLVQFFLEWEMFQTQVVGEIKTHIVCSVTFFPKIMPFMIWYMIDGEGVEYGKSEMIRKYCQKK